MYPPGVRRKQSTASFKKWGKKYSQNLAKNLVERMKVEAREGTAPRSKLMRPNGFAVSGHQVRTDKKTLKRLYGKNRRQKSVHRICGDILNGQKKQIKVAIHGPPGSRKSFFIKQFWEETERAEFLNQKTSVSAKAAVHIDGCTLDWLLSSPYS